MFINLKDLASKGAIRLEGTEDLTGILPRQGDLLDFSPLQVQLEASDKAGMAEVTGDLQIEVEQSCSRCLTPVKQRLDIPFHMTFIKGEENKLELSDDEIEDEEDIQFVAEDRIELKPFLVESVLMALPFAPLCIIDCKGLCPVCGTNRNEQSCGCKQDKVDPRLAGLADFFKDPS